MLWTASLTPHSPKIHTQESHNQMITSQHISWCSLEDYDLVLHLQLIMGIWNTQHTDKSWTHLLGAFQSTSVKWEPCMRDPRPPQYFRSEGAWTPSHWTPSIFSLSGSHPEASSSSSPARLCIPAQFEWLVSYSSFPLLITNSEYFLGFLSSGYTSIPVQV